MCTKCKDYQTIIDKVKDALCPAVLGHDPVFYRQVAERQASIFNEHTLVGQALDRKTAQVIVIMYNRYMDALDALNGNGGGDD